MPPWLVFLPPSHICFFFSSAFLLLLVHLASPDPHCSCPHPALSLSHLVWRVLSRNEVGGWISCLTCSSHSLKQEWLCLTPGGELLPSIRATSLFRVFGRNVGADNTTSKVWGPHRRGSWSYRPKPEATTQHAGQGILCKDDQILHLSPWATFNRVLSPVCFCQMRNKDTLINQKVVTDRLRW